MVEDHNWLDWIGLTLTQKCESDEMIGCPLHIARNVTIEKELEQKMTERLKITKEAGLRKEVLDSIILLSNIHLEYVMEVGKDQKNKSDAGRRIFEKTLDSIIMLSKAQLGFIAEVDLLETKPEHKLRNLQSKF